MKPGAILIYDGDCAFCKNSLNWAITNLKDLPRYAAFQKIDLSEYQLSLAEAKAQVWLIDGETHLGGHRAVAWLFLNQKSLVWRALGHFLIAFSPISAWVYRWVAKNRHRLPGGTKECSIEDRP